MVIKFSCQEVRKTLSSHLSNHRFNPSWCFLLSVSPSARLSGTLLGVMISPLDRKRSSGSCSRDKSAHGSRQSPRGLFVLLSIDGMATLEEMLWRSFSSHAEFNVFVVPWALLLPSFFYQFLSAQLNQTPHRRKL